MDIRQLKSFIAAAEEGNLVRAAERLHLSQPALTRQIQLLEGTLAAELFVRTSRGMVLTQAGQAFLIDARNAVRLIDQAVDRARLAGRGAVGRLDIGAHGTACFDYLPRLMAQLNRRYPEVKLELHYLEPKHLVAGLRHGRLLVAFERRAFEEPDVAAVVAVREPVYLALPEGHPLARQTTVDIASLRDEPLIVGPPSDPGRHSFKFCHAHGFEPKVVRESDNMTAAVVLVASGLGCAILPRAVINLQIPGVVYRPLHGNVDLRMNVYCYHLKTERSPLLEIMLEAIRTVASP